jgi:hypothetical protein
MRDLRGTYVHRGDKARRRRRLGKVLLVCAFVAATGIAMTGRKTDVANAEPTVRGGEAFFTSRAIVRRLKNDLENAKGNNDLIQGQLDHAYQIIEFSTRFNIPAGLARAIFDASVTQGIDPELAFRLVRLESDFNPKAVSPVGAVGLTQLMPSTAALFQKGVTKDSLFDPPTNLRIGFKYLRGLIQLFDGDVRLALLAYNRGEGAVYRDLKAGIDPGNGYDVWVAKGYTGKGIIDQQ